MDTIRVLTDADAVRAARERARAEYVATFERAMGLTPCAEWLDRWWPTTRGRRTT